MGKYEQVVENFSCDVDTTYETVSGNQAKVTHKIGKVQTLKLIKKRRIILKFIQNSLKFHFEFQIQLFYVSQ